MTQQYLIIDTQASPHQINEVLDRLRESIGDMPSSQIIIGCLAMAIIVQKPDIDVTQLPEMVMSASRHICLLLTGTDEVSPERMN